MRHDEQIEEIHEDREDSEEIDEPRKFNEQGRALLHEETFMERGPQIISSIERFRGRVFRVRTDELRYEDGSAHYVDVVEHGGSFAIVANPSPREIVLVRQYRHPARRELWEIPAGTAHSGEDPLAGAARELAEETGFRAACLRLLGSFFVTPGFCEEMMYLVHASDLSAGEQMLDDDERIAAQIFTEAEACRMVATGEISDAKTIISVMWMRAGWAELTPPSADNWDTG
jgi:ADP-ribose pyrophosphatase